MLAGRCGIDLGYHERYVRIHAKSRGVVNDERSLAGGKWRIALGDGAACGEERQIDAAKALLAELFNLHRMAAKVELLARRAGRREQLEFRDRKAALFETAHELDTDRAACADDGDHESGAARALALHEVGHAGNASAGVRGCKGACA
jgi:hypothetical protein